MKNLNEVALDRKVIFESIKDAFLTLTPSAQFRNPVMFVTYLGALVALLHVFVEITSGEYSWLNIQIAFWLWVTLLFANFAQAIAQNRGKIQAANLKKTKIEAYARQELHGVEIRVPPDRLKKNDIIICEAGDVIPVDGEIIEGLASIDESAITGESAPVIRESGGDRSAVTAGTKVLSDRLKIQVANEPGNSFLDRMINLIEGAKRQKTPNEMALQTVLSSFTIIFLLVTLSLKTFGDYSVTQAGEETPRFMTVPVLIALLVCLIPTTISALLNAVAISGINRLIQRNVIAMNAQSVEASGDIDLLLIDKTGTITIGNRTATTFLPIIGVPEKQLAKTAQLASLCDETPEGRSIVALARSLYDLPTEPLDSNATLFIPFSPKTKMSGMDFKDSQGQVVRHIRKGAPEAIQKYIQTLGGTFPEQLSVAIQAIANKGGTPLLVSDNQDILGIIYLKDAIKGGTKEKFAEMRKMGIKTVMVTGDNSMTAAAIAAEAGVDEYLAEATPEMKLAKIREEQMNGRLVAMTGDGTNDAPALAQADVGVAMNTGTQESREAGNMVDLDSNPAKLIDIIEIGKQLLMTRGALLTVSIANDLAKYFAILPAIFGTLYALEPGEVGPLAAFNIMHLHSPRSAILSALIVNALIILAMLPLALRGVRYQPQSAQFLLRRNAYMYGIGGFIAPFITIKGVDMLITFLGILN